MHITRAVPTATLAVLSACAIGSAGPAQADDSLNGHYQAVVDGSRSNPLSTILLPSTTCDSTGMCTGWVSTPKSWGAPLRKSAGGSWTIDRTDPQGWPCPGGGNGPADLRYTFAPGSLAGSIVATKAAGACADSARSTATHSLVVQKCADSPDRGVCP